MAKRIAIGGTGWARPLAPAIVAAHFVLGYALPATAADPAWVSSHVRGTVIYLSGDKWEEVTQGQSLVVASVRTLRSGRLSLETDGLELNLGPSSVLELGSSQDHAGSQLRHYIGTMTISTTGSGAATVFLQAGRLSLTAIEGEVELTVGEAATALSIHTGTVSIRAPGGTVTSLLPGEYIATGNGIVVATASPETGAEKGPKAASAGAVLAGMMTDQSAGPDGSAGSAANGTSNGTGNGAGGNNGNAGGSGSGNSNAGGTNGVANSGNPNAGSGNNNAGGNANPGTPPNAGNSNGNGNGPTANNAGGNGNGNANGQANGGANADGSGGNAPHSNTDLLGVEP